MLIADDSMQGQRLAALEDKRVAVWGYGREGRAALSVLRRRFPKQTITLFCSEVEAETLRAETLKALSPGNAGGEGGVRGRSSSEPDSYQDQKHPSPCALSPIACDGGEGENWSDALRVVTTPADAAALSAFDVVIKSPGISPYREPYVSAEKAGVRFTSGTAIWFAEHAQAKTICVTGTKGKSTVTALIAHLLRAGGRRVALAGNIGLPLLELLEPEVEPDWWVIELSSFQTRDFGGAPTIALINNLYEEHLDWHATRANYAVDKLRIAQRAQRVVVNAGQKELAVLAQRDAEYAFNRREGWHAVDGAIWRGDERVLAIDRIPLAGEHNALNVCAALAAIEAAGEDAKALSPYVATFKPLPHRLQYLGARDGIGYVNDSISTTPYAAIEALRSMESGRPVTILVGGFDRGVDWTPFVDSVTEAARAQVIVTMGANGEAIADKLGSVREPKYSVVRATTLADALDKARAQTVPGGVILLSPGAPSFDQFKDYAERGREFARLAGFDPAAIAQIEGMGIA